MTRILGTACPDGFQSLAQRKRRSAESGDGWAGPHTGSGYVAGVPYDSHAEWHCNLDGPPPGLHDRAQVESQVEAVDGRAGIRCSWC